MNFVANLPHIKCYVRKEYLRDLEDGHGEFVDATIIAVKSIQGRALYFEAYLPEYGGGNVVFWGKNFHLASSRSPLYGRN